MGSAHTLWQESLTVLREAGISQPGKEALGLLGYAIQQPASGSLYHRLPELCLSAEADRHYRKLVQRRAGREPYEYIVGSVLFHERSFMVDPSVLIPRPETELLVEHCLTLIPDEATDILDLGCGSGCIGITIALSRKKSRVVLSDISAQALDIARKNQSALGANVYLLQTDIMTGLRQSFDFIVSNPPYLPDSMSTGLSPEVVKHEPWLALFAPQDGMACIYQVLTQAEASLRPGGYLLMEIGHNQADYLLDYAAQKHSSLGSGMAIPDLSGVLRFLQFQKKE